MTVSTGCVRITTSSNNSAFKQALLTSKFATLMLGSACTARNRCRRCASAFVFWHSHTFSSQSCQPFLHSSVSGYRQVAFFVGSLQESRSSFCVACSQRSALLAVEFMTTLFGTTFHVLLVSPVTLGISYERCFDNGLPT